MTIVFTLINDCLHYQKSNHEKVYHLRPLYKQVCPFFSVKKKRKEKKTLTVPGSKLIFLKSIIVIRKRKIVTKTARRKYLLPNFGEY